MMDKICERPTIADNRSQLMNTLLLEPGDLLQVKSTDLPPGRFVKLQPQSPSFLDISDPRAVLENAFRNFACLSKGDIFTFAYNDQTYDIAVLEIKPDTDQHAIVTMETDLEVDFATPIGYEPPKRASGASTPASGIGHPHGGPVHYQGTMAQSINYAAIAPNSQTAAAGAKAVSSNFLLGGHKLKGSKAPTPQASTPVGGSSTNPPQPAYPPRRTNGPQPLRLPPGKLFFGYEIKPVRKKNEEGEPIPDDEKKTHFSGQGQKLRARRPGDGGAESGTGSDAEGKARSSKPKEKDLGRTLGKKGR
jgi:ubiquitin fusion degradation protein 1